MSKNREIPSLAVGLRRLNPPSVGTTSDIIRERYAHLDPASVVAQFERDVSDFAKLLVDDDLAFWADLKGALVWCIDDLLETYRRR